MDQQRDPVPWDHPDADPLRDLWEALNLDRWQRQYVDYLSHMHDYSYPHRVIVGWPQHTPYSPAFIREAAPYTPPPRLTYTITSTEGITSHDHHTCSDAVKLPGRSVSYRRPKGL